MSLETHFLLLCHCKPGIESSVDPDQLIRIYSVCYSAYEYMLITGILRVYWIKIGRSRVHWNIQNDSLFVWFDSLRPINNLSVIKGRVFLGRNSTKLGLMFLHKDTTQWSRWGSNPRPFGLKSSTLPLSHCALLQNDRLRNQFSLYTNKMYISLFVSGHYAFL